MIKSEDIQLKKAQVNLDTGDGGGAMTGVEVVDGQSNNLFPDVSTLDLTYGRVALRKVFPAVLTEDTDSYFGAHAIVSKVPTDPLVSVALFTTNDWFDHRDAARDKIERYLALGPLWPGHLLEKQLEGQRAIQLCMRPQDDEPKVGQGLGLVEYEGLPNEFSQYVRVTKVTSQDRTFFSVDNSEVLRKVVTVDISDPLRYTFTGPTVREYDEGASTSKAVCRDTRVANAAKYYGATRLAVAGAIDDMSLMVQSIFTQLVPSAQSETPLMDLNAAGLSALLVPGSDGLIATTVTGAVGPSMRFYIGSPVYPGTLQLTGTDTVTDDGGVLYVGAAEVGTIEYGTGRLTFTGNMLPYSGSMSLIFKPAAAPTRVQDTACISIEQGNRGYNHTLTLDPVPMPGSMVVSYVAQGKVYYLYDRGNGQLKGVDNSFGSGSTNFVTGTVLVTTGALPDAGTDIIFSWGKRSSTFTRGGVALTPSAFDIKLANAQAVPTTVTVTWVVEGVTKSATDDGNGNFTGDATGTINYARSEIHLVPAVLYQQGTEFKVAYQFGPPNEQTFPMPTRMPGGDVSITLPNLGGNIIPKSLELVWNVDVIPPVDFVEVASITQRIDPLVQAFDNGSGGLKRSGGISHPGTVNYATREIIFTPEFTINVPMPVMNTRVIGVERTSVNNGDGTRTTTTTTTKRRVATGWELEPSIATMPLGESGYVIARWRTGAGGAAVEETFVPGALVFDLTPGYAETIVAGSVRFELGGLTYIDRLGAMYHSIDPTTGSGVVAGTISYLTGAVTITDWSPSAVNGGNLRSLVTEMNVDPIDEVTFRIPVIPVRPGTVQVRAVPTEFPYTASAVMATADGNGRFNTEYMTGVVDYQTGVIRIKFGRKLVVTPEMTSEPWYVEEATFMEGGVKKVIKPRFVYADTVLYNAVGYTYLPLSASILGLDPVRLPSDGRVPIFQEADVVVVHHTDTTPSPLSPVPAAGTTLDVGRPRLDYIKLYDSSAERQVVDATMYETDVVAGTVTLGATYVQGSYVLPLVAEHRISDTALVTDVQINGRIAINRRLSHTYPVTDTLVSSALIITDMQARAYGKFSQESWTGEWSDSIIGNPIIAQYNDVQWPILMTNKGSTEEDWAIIFTSNTSFRVVGRSLGQIATGDTSTDCAPLNPATGLPYFVLRALGWGGGWAAGNVLRFNTAGANFPIWVARTVLQGDPSALSDRFQLQVRGDIDR